METKEKIQKLDSVIETSKMTEEELTLWWTLRQPHPAFKIAYKKGDNIEILPELILERKDEIWGFEIIPGVILAKKTGPDKNVKTTSWNEVKIFAENCIFNGKKGSLPSFQTLQDCWTDKLVYEIQSMDMYLCNNDVDAETKSANDRNYVGIIWCQEEYNGNNAYYFDIEGNYTEIAEKDCCYLHDRLAIAFE